VGAVEVGSSTTTRIGERVGALDVGGADVGGVVVGEGVVGTATGEIVGEEVGLVVLGGQKMVSWGIS